MVRRTAIWTVVFLTAVVLSGSFAAAQLGVPGSSPAAEPGTVEIPRNLTPEMVDSLLARLTDADIRAILRDELRRRAEEQVSGDAGTGATFMAVGDRLSTMATTIQGRVTRWSGALVNIDNRFPKVAERLERADGGVGGMVMAFAGLAITGIAAALAVAFIARPWTRWLAAAPGAGYWERVLRSLALGALELAPVAAFVSTTLAVAPFLADSLGPLRNYVWIYQAGVSYGWGLIVITRRAFAPDTQDIRIAPLDDADASQVYRLVRRAAIVGIGGWLVAGLSPTLGFGFPPAMVIVAVTGTAVSIVLFIAIARNAGRIRSATAHLFSGSNGAAATSQTALERGTIQAAPVVLGGYIFIAGGYWVANWLESGQQHLYGPVGTVGVFFTLPILDRLGLEVIRSVVRGETGASERYRNVFKGAWRIVLCIGAVFTISDFWGLDLWSLTKGENAPGWADTAFDVAVTLLLALVIWRLIKAALHVERRVAGGGEDDPAAAAGSRFDTLTPILRNVLLGIVAVVVLMIVLSSIGVDIGPLLASAGIIGIAVGFGAQTLVRDIFSGLFFLIDDAFRVGEYIELDTETRGEVEAISIRSLQLRHHLGSVITIPFGEMRRITNHNRDWVIYKMAFRMEPGTDMQQVKKLVKQVGREFLEHPEHGSKFIEPLKSQGVIQIEDDGALMVRVKFKCYPRAQFVLRREIYHRLTKVFEENGMRFARRRVEVIAPDGSTADDIARGALTDESLGSGPAMDAALPR